MKTRLLESLVCLSCRSNLVLKDPVTEEAEIVKGMLSCSRCGRSYPIEEGVPSFWSASANGSEKSIRRTANSFGYLWRQAFDRPLAEEFRSYHQEEIREALGLPPQRGMILDAGCGEGIDLVNQARQPGAEIVGVELSRGGCWASLQRTRRLATAHVVQADLCAIPFPSDLFDFIYSYGVLHHMADPPGGLKELIRVAKPGAWVTAYLYEDFSDRSNLWKALLGLGNLPRQVTTRLPQGVLYFLCRIASPLVYLFFTVPFRVSQRLGGPLQRWMSRTPFRHAKDPWDLTGDLFDRFSAPVERRYSRDSAAALFRESGLRQIKLANRRGWVVGGIKP